MIACHIIRERDYGSKSQNRGRRCTDRHDAHVGYRVYHADLLYRYQIEVNKPDASQAILHKNANIFIAVTEDGNVWLDKREVAPDSVRANIERLLTEQPTDYVIIQADVKAKHGLVVEIMDQVKAAGVNRVSVAARG